jgi:flagellin
LNSRGRLKWESVDEEIRNAWKAAYASVYVDAAWVIQAVTAAQGCASQIHQGGNAMGLKINTNVPALNTARVLNRSTLSLNRSLERLASGLRINRAADDAAGLAIAESFNSVIRGVQVSQRNAQDGVSLVQTAEGALAESTAILQRIRELAVQSANGTNSANNRASLQSEVAQLLQQIDDIASNTDFNGIAVLSAAQTVTLQTGAQQGQTLLVAVAGAKTNDLAVNTVNISSVAGAVAALSQVDIAIRSVTSLRANLGAFQNRLQFTINTLSIQEENSTASESAIRDANIATETISFTRNQILVSAGTSVLAQANLVPQTALTLLR